MSTIKETVKLYIVDCYGDRMYFTHEPASDATLLLGSVDVTVEYDESTLLDPREAALNQAEHALEQHRAESHVKEQQLLDRIQSLKALTHEGGRSEPLD